MNLLILEKNVRTKKAFKFNDLKALDSYCGEGGCRTLSSSGFIFNVFSSSRLGKAPNFPPVIWTTLQRKLINSAHLSIN